VAILVGIVLLGCGGGSFNAVGARKNFLAFSFLILKAVIVKCV
jgi:hypothetical protein